MANRTLIVGDVHGCSAELKNLIRACALKPEDDLVLVGDLVAKGPNSAEVVRICRERNARAVMGNHDFALVKYHRARQRGEHVALRPAHEAVARSLSAEDFRYLDSLPLWLDIPEFDSLVVHAGLMQDVPLESQDPRMLMNMRTIDAQGQPSAAWDAGPLWGASYRGPRFVYFGHHAAAGLQQYAYALGLDTGCVYGRRLSGFLLPEGRLVSVRAERMYQEPVRIEERAVAS